MKIAKTNRYILPTLGINDQSKQKKKTHNTTNHQHQNKQKKKNTTSTNKVNENSEN
ncbi:hypothetical protein HYE43_03875 [Mycoplasmopsis bovis]|nr:hypothetical protein [Mycoplasmopsis bovis]QQH20293.1 hypothetical protein HYE43_03875 [Mycoplasmopsis bovis]